MFEPKRKVLELWGDYWNLKFPCIKDKWIGLLIGVDNIRSIMSLEYRYGPEGGPDAVRTPLGWSLCGPWRGNCDVVSNTPISMHVHSCDEHIETDKDLMSPIDFVKETELKINHSSEDRIAYARMKKSIKTVNGHFELPLLWRHENSHLPDNRNIAEKRLNSLKGRLVKDKALHERYTAEMQKYIDEEYAEIVSEKNDDVSTVIWYLPHHSVMNPKKPDKVRIVFDCAAELHGQSLNKALLQGPDLTNSLVAVLIRFREKRIAIVADIRSMFHQVKVPSENRDVLRFLWWTDGKLNSKPSTYRMTVHLFGAISSPSCAAFCLKQAVLGYGHDYSEQARKAVDKNFYVDNFLISCSSADSGKRLIAEVKQMLQKAGFELTKWISNNNDVISSLPKEQRGLANKSLPRSKNAAERVLGVLWDIEDDEFRFIVDIPEKPLTKRGILSMMHSLYDPLGFVAPVLIEAKSLLRGIKNRGWDETISEDERQCWKRWLDSLNHLKNLRVKRSFQNSENVIRYELHHFVDASMTALGAASYLRTVDLDMNFDCCFVLGKSYLAPLGLTIPKLELSAALTAARLDEMLRKELTIPIEESHFWSDSKAVLMSIRNSQKKFPVYVANRLAEIENLTSTENWHYIPSQINPADEVSRGISAKRLVKSGKWLTGPDFLYKSQDQWPTEEKTTLTVAAVTDKQVLSSVDKLIKRYSSWHRLKVATAWLLRYGKYLKLKVAKNPMGEIQKEIATYLTKSELETAENQLIKYEQRARLPRLFLALKEEKDLNKSKCSKGLIDNNPQLVNGMIRLNGRIGKAPVAYETRYPCVLPFDSSLTNLIIEEYHLRTGHSAGVLNIFIVVAHFCFENTPWLTS